MNRKILSLAIPSILANITVPIVGIVDVAIAGHIANASAIGGIAIGTMLFDLLYWNFGFLRVGTGGMTAQAYGRGDNQAMMDIFSGSMTLSLLGALFVWAIGWLFVNAVMWCVPCSADVEQFARQYFWIRIWAAPATLSLMAFKGWFIGMQNTVSPMVCDITVNVVNMGASYYLAVFTPLGAIGVAYGTVIAQYTGLLTSIVLMVVGYRHYFQYIRLWAKDETERLKQMLALNGNLILRSLGFMVVYVGFTVLTSKYGDNVLAVGTIMMKLFMVFSYFVDGFAYAGEALVGRYIGAQNRPMTRMVVTRLFQWTLGVGLVFTLIYLIGGEQMVGLMTKDQSVIEGSRPFLFWLVLMPFVSCAAFMWDGIFIGATAGRQVRDCMLFAALGFVLAYLGLFRFIGVQAVYVGYFVHLLVRTLYLSIRWKKVLRRSIPVLLLLLTILPAKAQNDSIYYEEVDSAFWARIEKLMAEAKAKQVIGVIEDYEDVMTRKEKAFHTDGLNLLLRGLLSLHKDREFRNQLSVPMKQHDADVLDYGIAFSPLAVTWGLKAAGVQPRSKTLRMLVANTLAYGLTYGITHTWKQVTDETRPNGVDLKSMPSGHAAMAFASATILHREYGHISPWISVGGYATATATQFMRVRRNEHWLTDTYVGAGIGAVATNFAYFITDKIFGDDGFNRPKLKMYDVVQAIKYNTQPSSLTLISGFEAGKENKVRSSTVMDAGLEYSYFFDPFWAVEAMGRVATCSIDDGVATDNFDMIHLDAGVKFSIPNRSSSRFALRLYAGGRYVDNQMLRIDKELKPEIGAGIQVDFLQRKKYLVGVGCDYNHTFSDWFTNRWVVNMQWKILL
ncbi:MAG: MATE family efflux transporter [Bacteroidaceae bacterium]|nr:MATE family efflux transporter [Bacteroidaceae bacterium]